MATDANEAKDGGVLRDRYGRKQMVAVQKHATPAATDLPAPDGYQDVDGREQVVLLSGTSGSNLLSVESSIVVTLQPGSSVATGITNANGGELRLRAGTHTASGLVPVNGMKFKGDSRETTILKVTSGDLFSLGSGLLEKVAFEDLTLQADVGAGHLFVGGSGGVGQWEFRRCNLRQLNAAKSIWRQVSAGAMIDNLFIGCFQEHVDGATVPAWNLVTANGDINTNRWVGGRILYSGEYFFYIEQTAAGTYVYDNVFRDINAEVCRGGFAKILSGQGNVVENVGNYDMAAIGASTRDWIVFGKSASAPGGLNNIIRNTRRANGSNGGGLVDIKLSSVGGTLIEWPTSATGAGYAVDLGSTGGVTLAGQTAGMTITNRGNDTLVLDPYARSASIWTKAGIPSDADYAVTPPIGTQVLDTTNNRLYIRTAAATWKYAALT